MSSPLATARRSAPPDSATTSTRNLCAERPRWSTATGPDGSGACRSSTALADMYVTAVANALARNLVVPPHRPGGQAQFIPAAVAHGRDHVLADVLPWALERLEHPLTVRALAREAGMGSRNLARHFKAVTGTTPLRWLLTQRVRRAQELLENSDLSVEQIASRTGMGTATTLRRHFRHQLGVSPEAYRRTFRP